MPIRNFRQSIEFIIMIHLLPIYILKPTSCVKIITNTSI